VPPDVWRGSGDLPVGGGDDYVLRRDGEQVRQACLEDRILGQVIDEVERDGQVGGEQPPVGEAGAAVEEKALGRLGGEPVLAPLDGGPGDV
jgi:hypothetical protein